MDNEAFWAGASMFQIPEEYQKSFEDAKSSTTLDRDRSIAESANKKAGSLDGYDCPLCKNRGYFTKIRDDGARVSVECECMSKRRALYRIKKSGLENLLRIYTFDTYKTNDAWHKKAKAIAQEYAQNMRGWFYIYGNPGSGKTHLCTAICSEMIRHGKDVRYMLWRNDAPHLKAFVKERQEYEQLMNQYSSVPVLYIDDFLKGKVTDADVNVAFELINNRYNADGQITIISSERTINDILQIDEAIGSRIYERSRGYCIKTPNENWRLQ